MSSARKDVAVWLCLALLPRACLVLGFGVDRRPVGRGAATRGPVVVPVCVICRECCERTVSRFINRVLFSGTHVERWVYVGGRLAAGGFLDCVRDSRWVESVRCASSTAPLVDSR